MPFTQLFAQHCKRHLKGRTMSVQTQLKTDIHTRLTAMHAARAQWEDGTLRAANEELYAIL